MNRLLPIVLAAFLLSLALPVPADAVPRRITLDQLPHVHGLAVAANQPSGLYLATHDGLYLVTPGGQADPVAGMGGDLTSFVEHPEKPKTLLASGVTGSGTGTGVMSSSDGGRKWRRISAGRFSQAGFHIMAISKADPRVLYAAADGLYVSRDGGRDWSRTGPAPQGLIDLAVSTKRADTLFAATESGLLLSRDQGRSWMPAYAMGRPASMVHTSSDGTVHAFVVGVGLVTAAEPGLEWRVVSNHFDDRIIIRLTADPADPTRLYAATITGAIVMSSDGGKRWSSYEGSQNATPNAIAEGEQLFSTYCQACHGIAGKGQDPRTLDPQNPVRILAPALNDTAHAWHHSDLNLVETILNGSPQAGSPMIAWKSQLSRQQAQSIVAYIKSLWSFRSLACQGARHMSCMRH